MWSPRRTDAAPSRPVAGLAGVTAVGAAVGLAELLAASSDEVPSAAVAVAGDGGYALTAVVVGTIVVLGTIVGVLGRRRLPLAILGVVVLALAGAAVAATGRAGADPLLTAVAALSVGAVGGVGLWALLAVARRVWRPRTRASSGAEAGPTAGLPDPSADATGPQPEPGTDRPVPVATQPRRTFLLLTGGAAIGAGVAAVVAANRSLRGAPPTGPGPPTTGPPDRPATPSPAVREIAVPRSIDASGRTDVGAALTAFLATVEGPATVVFPEGGEFRVGDGTVWLRAATGVTLDFRGSTLRRTRILDHPLRYTESTQFLRLEDCVESTVRNLRVRGVNTNDPAVFEAWPETVFFRDGSDPRVPGVEGGEEATGWRGGFQRNRWWVLDHDRSGWRWCTFGPPDRFVDEPGEWGSYCVALEFEHGVRVDGGKDNIVEDCDLAGMGGDGVYGHGDEVDGLTVRRVKVRRNGRQGIAFNGGRRYRIEDCDIWSRRAAIDIEPDFADAPLRDIEISGCTLRSQLLPFASGGAGEIHDVFIHHNTIVEGGTPTLYVSSNRETGDGLPDARPRGYHKRRNWRFEDNVDTSPGRSGPRPAIHLDNVHGVVIARNVLPRRQGDGSAVAAVEWPSTGVVIRDNRFAGHSDVFRDGGPELRARTWAIERGYLDADGDPPSPTSEWSERGNVLR